MAATDSVPKIVESAQSWLLKPHPDYPRMAEWPLQLVRAWLVDWARVTQEQRRRWWQTMVIGVLTVSVVTLLLVWIVKALDDRGALLFEEQWLLRLLNWSPAAIWQATWMSNLAHVYVLLLLTLFVPILLIKDRRPTMAFTFGGAFLGASFFTVIGWNLWNRARPQLMFDGLLIADLHSFPSGHTAQAVATYGLLAYIWCRYSRRRSERIVIWVLAIVIVGLVMVGRLLLDVHWPSDIAAGFLIGGAWLTTLITALRRAGGDGLR